MRQAEAYSDYEVELLQKATAYRSQPDLAEVTALLIHEVATDAGHDFATAWLYHCIRSSPPHRDFVEGVEAVDPCSGRLANWDVRLAVVPGAFHRECPKSGADGRLVRSAALQCGMSVEVIRTGDFAPLEENARLICRWLLEQPRRPTLLISVCKGAADVRLALCRPEAAEAFRDVHAWVTLSGIPFGTPMADWVINRSIWAHWYRLLFALRGHDVRVLQQLRREEGPLANGEIRVPEHVTCIHVVGFPMQHHVSTRLARRCYRRILPQGINDGGGILLSDVCRLPGFIYPLWGADHYLRPASRDASRLVQQILQWTMDHDSTESSKTRTESTAA